MTSRVLRSLEIASTLCAAAMFLTPLASFGQAASRGPIGSEPLFVGQRHHGIVARRAQCRIARTGSRPDQRQRDGLKDPAR